jgi:tyrosinase
MVYRLPVGAPDDKAMAAFIDAMTVIEGLTDNRGYNHIAGFHGAPNWYCWHHQTNPRTPLQARLFLPWHRAYLYWLEQSLQDQVVGVAVPWWDWTAIRQIPDSYGTRRLGQNPNPLYSTRVRVPATTPPINRRTRRAPGVTPGAELPTAMEINDLLDDVD